MMGKTLVLFIILCAASFHAAAGNDLFGQPQRLCSALASEELRAKGGWKPNKAVPGEWSCISTFIPFGTVGSNGMENNIAFYVHGANNRAKDIRIKVNVNNAKERTQAFSRLNSAAKTLFKAISQPIPKELSKAISQQKPILINTSFGKIELMLKPGEIDSFKIVLTITESLSLKK